MRLGLENHDTFMTLAHILRSSLAYNVAIADTVADAKRIIDPD